MCGNVFTITCRRRVSERPPFAAGMSIFMLVAIRYEERDLVDTFGEDYIGYRAKTGMLTPRLRRV